MSAIVGILNAEGQPVDPQFLTRMTDCLSHRGPDGAGHWVEGAIGLGHRLLRITPESFEETQPFISEDGLVVIVCDGRMDNRTELQKAFITHGITWRTETDAELILKAYQLWGTASAEHMVGDFAFALWDRQRKRLICARDAIGVKPLYYRWDGNRLLLASEIKAILQDPAVPKRPNESTIAGYLLMGFRDPEATFFEDIHQLPPAHTLFLEDGRLTIKRYWNVDPSRRIEYGRQEEYEEQFRELFREAVQRRMASSSPVGILLSGGIDSTAVASIAATIRRRSPSPPDFAAFTLLVEGFLREEWQAIQAIETTFGTELHTLHPGNSNGSGTLFELFLETSEILPYDGFLTISMLLQPAAERGCRVILTGFGADELSLYTEQGFLEDLLLSGKLRQFTRGVKQYRTAYGAPPGGIWATSLKLLWTEVPPQPRWLVRTLLRRQVPSWLEPSFANRVGLAHWRMSKVEQQFASRCQRESYRALTQPAMSFMLSHIDGMASSFSLECRHPYLDRQLIEFFLSIPSAVKMNAGYRKQFVQKALTGVVPGGPRRQEDTVEAVPRRDGENERALEGRRIVKELFDRDALVFRYVNRIQAKRLTEQYVQGRLPGRYRNLLWNIVRLELWLRRWFGTS